MSKLKNQSGSPRFAGEAGITQIVVMILLLAGIAVGTYLVSQKTNLLPKADEGTCTYDQFCDPNGGNDLSAGQQSCTGTNPNGAGENQCGYNPAVEPACSACNPISNSGDTTPGRCKDVNPDWVYCSKSQADSGFPVDNNGYTHTDNVCYRKIYQYADKGPYTDPEDFCCTVVETPAANQTECKALSQGSSGEGATPGTGTTEPGGTGITGGANPCRDNPVTPPEGNQWVADCSKSCADKSACPLPNPANSNISNQDDGRWCFGFDAGNRCMVLKEGTSLTCNTSVATTSYYETKVATNLAFYEGILRGAPNTCVKADLGLDPHIYAHANTGDGTDERRLFLCGGANNKPGSLDLTWRVLSGDGQTLVLTKENFSLNPSAADWPSKNQAAQARQLLGVSTQ